MLCISFHFIPLNPLALRMDHAKLLDVLMSLPVSHAILPRAVCFSTSRPANHAICSFIDSSGYAFGPIRICLFIDYIINEDKDSTVHTIEYRNKRNPTINPPPPPSWARPKTQH